MDRQLDGSNARAVLGTNPIPFPRPPPVSQRPAKASGGSNSRLRTEIAVGIDDLSERACVGAVASKLPTSTLAGRSPVMTDAKKSDTA
jgi:hypothetical protein